MISALMYKIDQWNIWQRGFLLLSLIVCIHLMWYLFLEKPLLKNNQVIIAQQAQDQQLEKELGMFAQLRDNFVYKNNLGLVSIKQAFQEPLSVAPKLSMISYTDHPAVVLSSGAAQFANVATALHVVLANAFQQFFATLVFTGPFGDFLKYLKAMQNNSQTIYFDSIRFNMNRYPNAEITIKVFTLER